MVRRRRVVRREEVAGWVRIVVCDVVWVRAGSGEMDWVWWLWIGFEVVGGWFAGVREVYVVWGRSNGFYRLIVRIYIGLYEFRWLGEIRGVFTAG